MGKRDALCSPERADHLARELAAQHVSNGGARRHPGSHLRSSEGVTEQPQIIMGSAEGLVVVKGSPHHDSATPRYYPLLAFGDS
eukprot:6583367-Prorocentrum_lima.AAC.1